MDLTPADIEEDYWAHYYYENDEKESFEDDDFDIDQILADGDDWETIIDR